MTSEKVTRRRHVSLSSSKSRRISLVRHWQRSPFWSSEKGSTTHASSKRESLSEELSSGGRLSGTWPSSKTNKDSMEFGKLSLMAFELPIFYSCSTVSPIAFFADSSVIFNQKCSVCLSNGCMNTHTKLFGSPMILNMYACTPRREPRASSYKTGSSSDGCEVHPISRLSTKTRHQMQEGIVNSTCLSKNSPNAGNHSKLANWYRVLLSVTSSSSPVQLSQEHIYASTVQ